MKALLILAAIAVVTETIIDALKKGLPGLQETDSKIKKVGIFYVMGVGISFVIAYIFDADLFRLLSESFEFVDVVNVVPYVGWIATSIITSLGSKFVYDYIYKQANVEEGISDGNN